MYDNYQPLPDRTRRLWPLLAVLMVGSLLAIAAAGIFLWQRPPAVERPVYEQGGTKQVSTVKDEKLAVYTGTGWEPQFWNGINLGATTPGHFPGDLSPTTEDYRRWFEGMKKMNVDVVRIYTILPPRFYEALDEFNSRREDPLWFVQGVWTPEEELIGENEEGRDAYSPDITGEFEKEISNAVKAVHGDADLPQKFGHASGTYRTDTSEYLLGWILGTEWYPYAVQATNEAHPGRPAYSGEYFQAKQQASPFESWLAARLDTLAKEEMRYGWQHPVSFTNWLTTDPLEHPNEPLEQEDLVPVDPMHLEPTDRWSAGYFAAYHAYPYYPDFLRFQQSYQNYRTADGDIDPYAGYLNELRDHHAGIPLVVAEFGVPSSRGMAHYGPLDRDQGMHTEKEQGEIDAGMIEAIHNEGYDGALLFSWQDEWFKFTWNTIELELPWKRRDDWRNRLTNEENFGVVSVEPGKNANDVIRLDGETGDWRFHRPKETREYKDFDLSVSHDEAYLYLLMKKKEGNWDLSQQSVDLGFSVLPDGSRTADRAPGVKFPGGIQFLMQLTDKEESKIYVNSGYDQHTWLYSEKLGMLPADRAESDVSKGEFLPWKLATSRELVLPETKETIPFEEVEVGKLRPGITDPDSPDFNSLADYYAEGDVLEVRIPWMLLGYTDPSTQQVWNYPYKAGAISPVDSPGVEVYPVARPDGLSRAATVEPLDYDWKHWDDPVTHERRKRSYYIVQDKFAEIEEVKEAR